jgi:putative spermidine/putrescine transport system permease protein
MVFILPLILPAIIYAVGLLTLWSATIGPISPLALLLSHSVLALPYVVRTTLAVLAESDPNLEEAARTMGANRFQRLFFVIVPQCIPGLAAGAFFSFNVSFDESVLSLFLRGPTMTTLPIQIYGQLEFNPDPSVAAVSTILIGLTVVMVLAIEKILGLGRVGSA